MTLGLLTGCSNWQGLGFVGSRHDVALQKGPAIQDVVTPFDMALTCVRGKIEPSVSFAVGQVIDATGKETFSDGGTGKMLSQGAGEMVQTALYRAGVTVVNRRDPNIPIVETQWGIRDIKQLTPANFYVSGSINSLDFIPGGGIELDLGGIGARNRQTRILIALDLTLTDAFTGRIVANVPLQKQIFAQESGVGVDRFFDTTLASLSVGGMKREAVHFAMRQMLNFATLELLGQLMADQDYLPCKAMVAPVDGMMSDEGTAANRQAGMSQVLAEAVRRNREAPLQPLPAQQPTTAVKPAPAPAAPVKLSAETRKLMERATAFAGRALVAAQASRTAPDPAESSSHAKEALQFLAVAIQSLKTAAAAGLAGSEGDAVALLVEQAIREVQTAQQLVQSREAGAAATPAPASSPTPEPESANQPAIEGSREDQRLPGAPP